MGYTTLRAALADYFEGIAGVQHIYLDVPWYLDGANWTVLEGETYGAMFAIHIDRSDETRITLPAYTGQKAVDYTVSILIQYQYLIPDFLAAGTYEDQWVTGRDTIYDTVKDRIRADQLAGTAGGHGQVGEPIFQMGDNPSDLAIESDLPVWDTEGARVYELGRVEFHVTEIIIA